MWILKVLQFLWPFIKEMVLGDKTLREAIKDNKKKVALALMIMVSLGLNFFFVARLVDISKNYLELQKEHKAEVVPGGKVPPPVSPPVPKPKPPALETPVQPDAVVEDVPKPAGKKFVQKTTKKTKRVILNNDDRYSKMKETFDKIKEREEKAGL